MIDGKNGQIDAERLVGQVAAARDFLGEVLRRRLRQRGDQAERAGIGNGRDQLGASDPLHAALHDRVFDADEFGEPCLDHCLPSVSPARPTARAFLRFPRAGCRRPPQKSTGQGGGQGNAIMQKRGLCFREDGQFQHSIRGATRTYWRNSLVSSPMPPIATVTVLTGSFMTPTTDSMFRKRSGRRATASCRARSC